MGKRSGTGFSGLSGAKAPKAKKKGGEGKLSARARKRRHAAGLINYSEQLGEDERDHTATKDDSWATRAPIYESDDDDDDQVYSTPVGKSGERKRKRKNGGQGEVDEDADRAPKVPAYRRLLSSLVERSGASVGGRLLSAIGSKQGGDSEKNSRVAEMLNRLAREQAGAEDEVSDSEDEDKQDVSDDDDDDETMVDGEDEEVEDDEDGENGGDSDDEEEDEEGGSAAVRAMLDDLVDSDSDAEAVAEEEEKVGEEVEGSLDGLGEGDEDVGEESDDEFGDEDENEVELEEEDDGSDIEADDASVPSLYSSHFNTTINLDLAEEALSAPAGAAKRDESDPWGESQIVSKAGLIDRVRSSGSILPELIAPLARHWTEKFAPAHREDLKALKPSKKDQEDIGDEHYAGFWAALRGYRDVNHMGKRWGWTDDNALRLLYCTHIMDHLLRSRQTIMKHNSKVKAVLASNPSALAELDLRDQGLTRPSVLVLVPTRAAAHAVVSTLASLVPQTGKSGSPLGAHERFEREFGVDPERRRALERSRRPEDWKEVLGGNNDDCFRLGLTLNRKTLIAYAKFYSSDIILATPLGLRLALGEPGDKRRDVDFLSSIEMTIVDGVDLLRMQNWDHTEAVLGALNQKPKAAHGVDFSRVREWVLNGWGKLYRQTVFLSRGQDAGVMATFRKFTRGIRGQIRVTPRIAPDEASIAKVIASVRHMWQYIPVSGGPKDGVTARWDYFVKQVWPQIKTSGSGGAQDALSTDAIASGSAIFVPSYFDYVRLRKFLHKERIDFAVATEYSGDGDIRSSRARFFKGTVPLLVFTERFHYYHRFRLRGIKSLVFYGPPTTPSLYPDLLNLLEDTSAPVISLFTKYDSAAVSRVVGTERARRMLTPSDEEDTVQTFMFQ